MLINPVQSVELTKRLRPESKDPLAHYGSMGIGSLQSYYEDAVESENPTKKTKQLPHPNKGSPPLFGWLDVMPGAASAPNQCIWSGTGIDTNTNLPKIDNAALDFQIILGKYRGYRLSSDPEFKEEKISSEVSIDPTDLYAFQNSTIFKHEAQARHGMHYIDPQVNREAAEYALQTTVGDALQSSGRNRGFERELNPANNGGKGENAFHNPLTMDKNVPTVIPMEPDSIRINNVIVRPEDTAVALGGNVAPDINTSS